MEQSNKTLLQILTEELPKRGGWPKGADYAVQDNDGSCDIKFGAGEATIEYEKRGVWVNDKTPDWGIDTPESYIRDLRVLASDAATAIVTREQYEAALAVKTFAESHLYYVRTISCVDNVVTLEVTLPAPVGVVPINVVTTEADGWIDWAGGECPVGPDEIIDIKASGGWESYGVRAGEYSWAHNWKNANIIAYRLHQPQEAECHVHAGSVSGQITTAPDEADLNDCIGQTPEDLDHLTRLMAEEINYSYTDITLANAYKIASNLIDAGYRKQ